MPTEVQQAALPVILSGENAAIQSYTGSGKVPCHPLRNESSHEPANEMRLSYLLRVPALIGLRVGEGAQADLLW